MDAIGFIVLGGLFVSHMTGNSTFFGIGFGEANWPEAWPHLLAVPVFVAGIVAGHVLVSGMKWPLAGIFLVEAVLLVLFAILLPLFVKPGGRELFHHGLALLPLVAMGLQNATIRKCGGKIFHTTYMTGVLDTLGESLAGIVLAGFFGKSSDASHRSALLGALSVWGCYVAGAVFGSAGVLLAHGWMMLIPAGILIWLSVMFRSGNAGSDEGA